MYTEYQSVQISSGNLLMKQVDNVLRDVRNSCCLSDKGECFGSHGLKLSMKRLCSRAHSFIHCVAQTFFVLLLSR